MPALHIRAISLSFQVGLIIVASEANVNIMRPHEENCFCKNFKNWPSNRNFCSPYKNSVLVVVVVVFVVVIIVGQKNLTLKFGQNWVNDK